MRWPYVIAVSLFLSAIPAHAQEAAEALENPSVSLHAIIGTPEHPTIEGGWINQAENHNANHPFPQNVIQDFSRTPLADEFSSDKAIKKLLCAAAEQHKLAYVLHRAEQLKLPATVALIPMIESRYQTHAISPKGAKGAWQLMPETAKAYGLNRQSCFEFTASTNAALQLLKKLHQKFNSWTLAFAAYNAGSQSVLSALQQNPKARCVEALPLPRETRAYLRRFKQLYQSLARLSAREDDASRI